MAKRFRHGLVALLTVGMMAASAHADESKRGSTRPAKTSAQEATANKPADTQAGRSSSGREASRSEQPSKQQPNSGVSNKGNGAKAPAQPMGKPSEQASPPSKGGPGKSHEVSTAHASDKTGHGAKAGGAAPASTSTKAGAAQRTAPAQAQGTKRK